MVLAGEDDGRARRGVASHRGHDAPVSSSGKVEELFEVETGVGQTWVLSIEEAEC